LYLSFFVLLQVLADRIAFQPHPVEYRDSNQILKLTAKDGSTLSARFLSNSNARYTILYSHGNGEDLGDIESTISGLRDMGFSVFAYDYRGYGTSTGHASESNAYEDEELAYSYLINELHVLPERIIAYGHSIGGAMAVDLASRRPLAGLVMESTFVSGFRVLTHFSLFPFDRFRNLEKLKQTKCPVLIIHGRRDGIIPFWHGERLFTEANEPKQNLWISSAGHNDISDTGANEIRAALMRFCDGLK
jgi:fermentation-respiration switch protein FrsA (DUF1100 family)